MAILPAKRIHPSLRRGSSYLEVQVAMVMLAISTAGLYSVSVVNTKQTAALMNRTFDSYADEDAAINAHPDEWARKLGVMAEMGEVTLPAPAISSDFYFTKITDNSDSTGSTYFRDTSDSYGWTHWDVRTGYRGTARYHYQPSNVSEGSYMEQQITGIPAGTYEILVTYPAVAISDSAVQYEIFDGNTATPLAVSIVDHRLRCNDAVLDGHVWKLLRVLPINSGTLRIRISDGPIANNFVIGDAIAVRTRRFQLTNVEATNNGGATATLENR